MLLLFLIIAAAGTVIYMSQDILDFNIPNPFYRKTVTAGSTAVLEQVRDISRLNTIEFIYKIVFPHDLVDPDTDWNAIARQLGSGKKLSFDEIEKVSVFAIAADAGIDLQKDRYSFAVVSARITAGFELEGWDPDEEVILDSENKTAVVNLPEAVITDIVIDDEDSTNYRYPDLNVSPNQWKALTAIISGKLRREAEERGILRLAEERGRDFIEQLLLSSGFRSVEFR